MSAGKVADKQDRRAAESGLRLNEPHDFLAHVGIVGVDLVEDQHSLRQPHHAHALAVRGEHGENGLVDRADADLSKERQPALVGDPLRAIAVGGRVENGALKPLVKPARAMREGKRRAA